MHREIVDIRDETKLPEGEYERIRFELTDRTEDWVALERGLRGSWV